MKRTLILYCLLLVLVLSACSSKDKTQESTNNENTGEKKVVSVGFMNPVGSINPINTTDVSSKEVINLLFDSLFDVTSDLEFVPKLASSFETTDNQTFKITLAENANWTDGTPVTSEDVLFTLTTMANPDVQSLGIASLNVIQGLDDSGRIEGEDLTQISGFKIVDEKTFEVTTKSPLDSSYLKENLGYHINIIPKHILGEIEPAELHMNPFIENPNVTSGAFKLVKLAHDSHVEFIPNEDYYRGAPILDQLIFKIMPSSNLVAQLQTGEIQMVHPGAGQIPVQDYERVRNIPGITTKDGKPYNYQAIWFNTEKIEDPNVRLAMTYAINREMLVDKLLQGEAEVVNGPFTSIHPYFNKEVEIFEHNPEKAKQLLKESNWDMQKPLNITVPVGNQIREQAAAIIAENLKEVGFNAQITKYDFPTLMQKGKDGDFDLLIMGMPLRIDPNRAASIIYDRNGAINYSNYDSPVVQELFAKGSLEPNPEKRKEIYDEMQQVINKDLPLITIFAEYSFNPMSTQMIKGEPKSMGMFYDVHEWDIK